MQGEYSKVFPKESYDKIETCEIAEFFNVRIGELKRIRYREFSFSFPNEKRYKISLIKSENNDFAQFTKKNSMRYIDLNILKYNIALKIIDEENPNNPRTIQLNRDSTIISHFTSENLSKLLRSNNIYSEQREFSFENFIDYSNFTNNLQIIIKTEDKSCVSEDLHYLYLMFDSQTKLINAYSYFKYNIYYSKESLCNYIANYLFELMFEFSHLSENMLYLLENLGITIDNQDTLNIDFPLKKKVKLLKEIYLLDQKRKIRNSIKKLKQRDNYDGYREILIHKFIQHYNTFNPFYLENEKLTIKTLSLHLNSELEFLRAHFRNIGSSQANEPLKNKLNEVNLIKDLFQSYCNETTKSSSNTEKIGKSLDLFLVKEIQKKMEQFIAKKGFFHIDVIFNDDNMMNIKCCKNKNCNKFCNFIAYKCFSNFLSIFNVLFEVNEGFFHKHLSILNYCYNFNEQNLIHIFKSKDDNSTKNKIRLFDLFFLEKWSYIVSTLSLYIIKDKYKFNLNIEESKNEDNNSYRIEDFPERFKLVYDTIVSEFFQTYENSLPDYSLFCNKISRFPLNKYNAIDNICQHFANSSLDSLLKNQIFTFQAFDRIYDLTPDKITYPFIPKMERILEPYLIYIDNFMYEYLNTKEKKESFLLKKDVCLSKYIQQAKELNRDRIDWSLFSTNNVDQTPMFVLTVAKGKSENEDKLFYEFNYLFNCFYYFSYKKLSELHRETIDILVTKEILDQLTITENPKVADSDFSVLNMYPRRNQTSIQPKYQDSKKKAFKILKSMMKMNKYSGINCYLYRDYVKYCSIEILNKFYKDCQNYPNGIPIKIGYYLMNLKAFFLEWSFNEEDFFNNLIYKKYVIK